MEPMLQPGDRYPIDAVGFCNSRLALTGHLTRGSDQVKRSFMDSPKTAPAKSLQNYTILS